MWSKLLYQYLVGLIYPRFLHRVPFLLQKQIAIKRVPSLQANIHGQEQAIVVLDFAEVYFSRRMKWPAFLFVGKQRPCPRAKDSELQMEHEQGTATILYRVKLSVQIYTEKISQDYLNKVLIP